MKISANISTGKETLRASFIKVKEPVRISSRFLSKLEQLLWIENHMASILCKAKKLSDDIKLKTAINSIVQFTGQRCADLEKAHASISGKAYKKTQMKRCRDFENIAGDFDASTDTDDKVMRDAAIVFEIQKMIQFKIEQYSVLCGLADEFNNQQISRLAEKALQNEICCDATLMELSADYLGEEDLPFLEDGERSLESGI